MTVGANNYHEPDNGTLVVDPVGPGGSQTWQRYIQNNQQAADTDIQYRTQGSVITSTTESLPQGTVQCRFTPFVPAPPWPPQAGQTFHSVGACGDNLTENINGRVMGTRSLTVSGQALTVWVVDSVITTSGDVNSTGTQEDWYSPALGLIVHEQTNMRGDYERFAFTLDSVSDLASDQPSKN